MSSEAAERPASGGTISGFRPAWWLPDRHSQTLWRRFSSVPELEQQRERLTLPDGDFLDLDWVRPGSGTGPATEAGPGNARAVDSPIVVLIHGLGGCSSSPYILSLQQLLRAAGQSSVAVNLRGCSGTPNRLARSYHSGASEDLEAVFQHLCSRYPDRQLAFAGFSLGANLMLKWLAEKGRQDQVCAAVAVSTPFSLDLCSRAMSSGLGRFYGGYFLRRLVAGVETRKAQFRAASNSAELARLEALGDLRELRTLWDFDERVTAPLHGFEGAEDYYRRCSSGPLLPAVDTPLLIVHSRNDPIIPLRALPSRSALPAEAELELTRTGGHVGFTSAGDRLWLEKRIAAFIIRHTSHTQGTARTV